MRKFKVLICVIIASLFMWSCKDVNSVSDTELTALIAKADADGNSTNLREVLKYIQSKYQVEKDDFKKVAYLTEGLAFAQKNKLVPETNSFLEELISIDYKNEATPQRMAELIKSMKENGRDLAADIMVASLHKNFPNAKETSTFEMNPEVTLEALPILLKGLAESCVDTTEQTGINRAKALMYIDACESYAISDPNSVLAPEYIFRAGEMARSARSISKALVLYDKLLAKYPTYDKSPTALFVKGFTLENDLKDLDKAKEAYQSFLEKYPNNQLSKDVKFLIDNLGKSDEELMKSIGKK